MAGFSQAVLDKAAALQRKAAKERPVAREVGGGERVMQIDSRLFHQGVAYGRKHGVHQPWDDPNFVQEVQNVHPEIVVGGGRVTVGGPLGNHPKRATFLQKRREKLPAAAYNKFLTDAAELAMRS